jgi:hypothetical protein
MHNNQGFNDHDAYPVDEYFDTRMVQESEENRQKRLKPQHELDRLCFDVFIASNDGSKLWELLEKRFLLPPMCAPHSPTFKQEVIYFEGFKQAIRALMSMAKDHQQRVLSGNQGV